MTKRVHVGDIIVDSASFWIGDPIYMPDMLYDATVPVVCREKRVCEVNIPPLVQGVTGYTADGDGTFPVYAEYDEDGFLERVILEFDIYDDDDE